MMNISLRAVTDNDLPIFYEQQLDADANYMAAFTASDPADKAAFAAHWSKIRGDDRIVIRTVLVDGQVAGHVAAFERDGEPEITYWIGKEFWGQGIATAALGEFLREFTRRPLYARAATDNVASLRVLGKCGFVVASHDHGFANARGMEIEEAILVLNEST